MIKLAVNFRNWDRPAAAMAARSSLLLLMVIMATLLAGCGDATPSPTGQPLGSAVTVVPTTTTQNPEAAATTAPPTIPLSTTAPATSMPAQAVPASTTAPSKGVPIPTTSQSTATAAVTAKPTATHIQASNVPIGSEVGQLAPPFTLTTASGQQISSDQYKGKPLLLNFFEFGCNGCVPELKEFEQAYQKYKEQGLVILAAATNLDAAGAEEFGQQIGVSFPVGVPGSNEVALKLFKIRSYPTSLFIGANGVVTARKIGPVINQEELDKFLSRILR